MPMHWIWVARQSGDEEAEAKGDELEGLLSELVFLGRGSQARPFATAPVRSKPRRTYDPTRPARDPEGDYVPMYLAHLAR